MLFRFLRYSYTEIVAILVAVFIALLFHSCANIGTPSGGDYDLDPPKLVQVSPGMKATDVKSVKTISMLFDENVQLDNPSENVIITPPQKMSPSFTSVNRRVKVSLRDSLIPKTTYVIDFTDALSDVNEKNIYENFVVTFSTGDKIDSMEISGTVLEAETLEPVTGIYVGLETDLSDSAFQKKPFDRISKTNSKGQFIIRGVAPQKYRLYALQDANRNFIYDSPGEEIAFLDSIIVPSSAPATKIDTVFKADKKTVDSLVTQKYTRFMPDNIILRTFSPTFASQYLKNYGRPSRKNIDLYFGSHTKKPSMKILGVSESADYPMLVEHGAKYDTVRYWITNPKILEMDTLRVQVNYLKTDTSNIVRDFTDTLKIVYREYNFNKKKKDKKKKDHGGGPGMKPDGGENKGDKPDKPNKDKKKKGKDGDDEEEEIEFLPVNISATGTIDVYKKVDIIFDDPVCDFDAQKLHLFHVRDSVEDPIQFELATDSLNPRHYILSYKWKLGESYRLKADSAAFHSYYGLWTDAIDAKFSIRKAEDYGMIYYTMSNLPKGVPVYVELLDQNGNPLRKTIVEENEAVFPFLNPGTYYARLFLDANNNGRWDTGDYSKKQQPELVCYFHSALQLKANFELQGDWDFKALPLDKQKPLDITKNKPKEKKTKRQQLEEQEQKKNKSKDSSSSTTSIFD